MEKPAENIAMEDCGVTDESFARMKNQLIERYGTEQEVVRDNTLEKMSDIIMAYGKPLFTGIEADDRAEYEKAIMMTMMLWNCALMEETPKGLKKTRKMLKPMMPDAESKSVVEYMLRRKNEMFPDNKRMMLDYELTEGPDGFHLSVASTVQMPNQNDICG